MIGSQIIHKDFCENSIKWCKENFDSLKDGTVLMSNKYDYAIGRQGRIWQLYDGQLLITFILKTNFTNAQNNSEINYKSDKQKNYSGKHLNHLNMSISLGIVDATKKYSVGLKWPNDFVINNKKVGGMIIHTIWDLQSIKGLVVGIGINVNNIFKKEDNLHSLATSIKQEIDIKFINIDELRDEILLKLNSRYNQYLQENYNNVFQNWKSSQVYLNKKILVHKKNGELISGIMQNVDSNGNLLLQDKFNKNHTLSFQSVENISAS